MIPLHRIFLAILFLAGNLLAQSSGGTEFFETKIRPLLANNCYGCHGPKMQMARLNLSTSTGFFKGADSGPIAVKGNPDNSRLIQVVSYQEKIKMPPTGKLKEQEIADL